MKTLLIVSLAVAACLASCGRDGDYRATEGGALMASWASPGEDYYNKNVGPNLVKTCKLCHANPAPDYATAKTQIVPGKPAESSLYLTTIGKSNHKAIWAEGTPKAEALREWIAMETR